MEHITGVINVQIEVFLFVVINSPSVQDVPALYYQSIIAPIVYLFWVLPVKVYILLIAIMGIDGGAQYIGFKESTNMRRFVTGCMGGFGITSLKILVVCNLLKKQSLYLKNDKMMTNRECHNRNVALSVFIIRKGVCKMNRDTKKILVGSECDCKEYI